MTTETTKPTVDELRAVHAGLERDLKAKKAELAELPERLQEAARRAAKTGDLEPVQKLQAQQLVLPEVIVTLAERVEAALRRVEGTELAELRRAREAAYPDLVAARKALEVAQAEFQRAATAFENARVMHQATEDNVMTRRMGPVRPARFSEDAQPAVTYFGDSSNRPPVE